MHLRKWLLRRQLRRMCLRHEAIRDQYDCGNELFNYIRPDMAALLDRIEVGVAELEAMEAHHADRRTHVARRV